MSCFNGVVGGGMSLLTTGRHTLTLQRSTKAQDAITGDSVLTWTDIKTVGGCSVQNGAGSRSNEFQRMGVNVSDRIYAPTEFGAKVGDRLFEEPSNYYSVVNENDMGDKGRAFCTYVWNMEGAP
jgi:hypothetical protein